MNSKLVEKVASETFSRNPTGPNCYMRRWDQKRPDGLCPVVEFRLLGYSEDSITIHELLGQMQESLAFLLQQERDKAYQQGKEEAEKEIQELRSQLDQANRAKANAKGYIDLERDIEFFKGLHDEQQKLLSERSEQINSLNHQIMAMHKKLPSRTINIPNQPARTEANAGRMTGPDWIKYFEGWCQRALELTRRKNHDYAIGQGQNDPFANFRMVEKLNICDVESGFLTRMSDKLARIISFKTSGNLMVKGESVHDTLTDLAIYSVLFSGYLTEKARLQALDYVGFPNEPIPDQSTAAAAAKGGDVQCIEPIAVASVAP